MPTSRRKPRIWWCPSGILSFLPLHAAGLYHQGAGPGSKLSDFVVSSYTPSLSALAEACSAARSHESRRRLLVVAQPTSKGKLNLPGALEEKTYIEHEIGELLTVSPLTGETATFEEVTFQLVKSDWVHFACHGVQSTRSPTESSLLLAGDDRLSLARIARLQIPRGEFAFLSACQTAKGDDRLADEAVHLSAGMLAAGYSSVIATMWSIGDRIAPEIARDVYKYLKDNRLDPREAANALDFAIKEFRDKGSRQDDNWFISWVPFIHLGR